ncbi:hypothetical protein MMC11_005743 [Xylographa trunciseda]|nr:hypothetical protein [Xylographa trunciseda]
MEVLAQSTSPGSVHGSGSQAVSLGSLPNPQKLEAVPATAGPSNPKPGNAAAREPSLWTVMKDVATFIFQMVAVIAALVFGVWAIKSYDAQLIANDVASQSLQYSTTSNQDANQLAILSGQLSLLAYCEAYGGSTNNQAICDAILAAVPLPSLVSALSLTLPSSFPTSIPLPITSIPVGAPSTTSNAIASTSTPQSIAPTPPASSAPPGAGSASSASSADLGIGAIIGIVVATVCGTVALITACIWRYAVMKRVHT